MLSNNPPQTQSEHKSSKAYWEGKLENLNYNEYISSDYPKMKKSLYYGDIRNFVIEGSTYKAINELCTQNRTRPFIFMLSVLKVLLFRYSNIGDIAIAAPISQRGIEYQNTVGMFVNTVILRTSLDPMQIFSEVLKNVNDCVNEAIVNSTYPLHKSSSYYETTVNTGRPICQFNCIYESNDFDVFENDKYKLQLTLVNYKHSKYPISFYIYNTGSSFKLRIEYDTSIFSSQTIENYFEHYSNLMNVFLAFPDFSISTTPYMPSSEIIYLSECLNDTHREITQDSFLHLEFERHAEENPHTQALAFEGHTISFAELNKFSNIIAHSLLEREIKCGDIIGVYADKSLEMIISMLAIFKTGATYLPLDKSYPNNRIQKILLSAKPVLVFTEENDTQELFRDCILMNVREEIKKNKSETYYTNPTVPNLSPQQPAYIIYTSGSTGEPKGVVISHQAIFNRIIWMREEYMVEKKDIILHKTSIMFDVSLWEILLPLVSGSKLIISKSGGNREPYYLYDLIINEKITIVHFVPIMLNAFLQVISPQKCARLRHVICSGEELNIEIVNKFYSLLPTSLLHNLYGPTEAAVDVTYHHCKPSSNFAIVPIGKPIWNTQIYILDDFLQLVPKNIVGNLYIGGICLANGYLGKEDLTAERFISHPLKSSHEKLYKTGDLAKWSYDDEVIFLGRIDRQIKIRGNRIETSEIENTLNNYPSVLNSYVCKTLVADNLIAYIQLKSNEEISIDNLKYYITQELPSYMIPSYFVIVDKFPTLASGKVDTHSLPNPCDASEDEKKAYSPPKTYTEKILAKIWKEVLNIRTIGIRDNFFHLGGDSIKSIELVVKARNAGIALTVEEIFNHPTIYELATSLSISKHKNDDIKNVFLAPFHLINENDKKMMPSDIENAYPLSYLQQALVYHSEASSEYNVYVTTFKIKSTFNIDFLKNSIQQAAITHPIMRAYFDVGTYSEPLQIIKNFVEHTLDIEDLSQEEEDKDDIINKYIENEKKNRFEWDKSPLFQFKIHILNGEQYQLTVSEPCLDGWSVALLMKEIFTNYYHLLTKNQLPQINELLCDYSICVYNERESLSSPKHKNYWNHQISTAEKTIVIKKTDKISPSVKRVSYELDSHTSLQIKQCAKLHNVPLKTVLLASHCLTISDYLKKKSITTGLMSNVRPEIQDGDKVVGIFLNVLPFTIDITDNYAVFLKDLLRTEKERIKYRYYPYAAMFAGEQNDVFDTLFNFTNFYPYKDFIKNDVFRLVNIKGTDQTLFNLTAQYTILQTNSNIRIALDGNNISENSIVLSDILDLYVMRLQSLCKDLGK